MEQTKQKEKKRRTGLSGPLICRPSSPGCERSPSPPLAPHQLADPLRLASLELGGAMSRRADFLFAPAALFGQESLSRAAVLRNF